MLQLVTMCPSNFPISRRHTRPVCHQLLPEEGGELFFPGKMGGLHLLMEEGNSSGWKVIGVKEATLNVDRVIKLAVH